MRTKQMLRAVAVVVAAAALAAHPAIAGEIGHYNPGIANIRELLVPEPGFYPLIYNYYYTTDRLNDADGDELDSVTVRPGPGPGVTLNVDTDVEIYALVPTLLWVSDWTILGAKYAAAIAPTFADSSLSAALSAQHGSGRNADAGGFGFGDLFVQPIWLGWTRDHFDAAVGYGFYAPTGKYDTDLVTLPVVGTTRVESLDNIGYGFWTHQIQTTGAWYPWADKRMAIVLAMTNEFHQNKEDFDITPGHNLTLNWGISQYLPLTKDHTVLAELGLSGYDSWQTSDDSGSDASNGHHDSVHAVGGQIGLVQVPWGLFGNFHYYYEFAAEDRFQGHALLLSVGKRF